MHFHRYHVHAVEDVGKVALAIYGRQCGPLEWKLVRVRARREQAEVLVDLFCVTIKNLRSKMPRRGSPFL
jgi:hypothetical protein